MDWSSVYYSFADPNSYHIGRVLCDACSGKLEMASSEVRQERRALCSICENKNKYGFCIKCGCNVNWKTSLAKSKCPIGIW